MTRTRDPLWECFVKLDGGILECKFCGHKFVKGTSLSRIRHHLSGVKGKGVKPCVDNVPEEIKEAALDRDDSSHKLPNGDLASGLADQSWDTIHAKTAFLLDETTGDPLPTSSTMLGKTFEMNARQIRSWIMDDEFSTIGIYGMAGVGKTKLLKHIHNELLQSQDNTHRLYWVHVSQNFSIERLQNLIAKCIGLDLSSEDDDQSRATKLSKELWRNQGWILFLDDLWDDCLDDFELEAVGIPETIKGCKLIVSTRSQDVCRTVAYRCIRVNPLSHEEAVFLFKKKLGLDRKFSPEKSRIADCIVNKCGGLPLGIIAMAGSMKRLYYDRQWRVALQDLEQSSASHSDMEKMEGVPPSFMDDDVNQWDLQAQEDNLNMSGLPSSPAGQKTLVDNDVINDSIQQTPQLPEPSQTLRSPQFPPHNLQVSGDHNQGHVDQASVIPHLDNMQLENSVPRNFGKSNRSQMDDLQVRGFADLPHQRGLAKQKLIRQQVYASNPGPDSSLKSQNKGLNTQQEQRRKGIEMAGSNIERFWNHVKQTNNGRLQCKFCGNLFAKGTSISRIKFHLSGEKGRGLRICGQVPKQVQEAALLSMPGGGSTLKTMRQRRKRIDASEQEQNNVGVAQQQEPLLTGEFKRANDLTGGRIELQHDAPDDQDELKKLKGSKYRDMVDFLKSGWTLLLTNLILEMASAVFDQLGNAFVGMVLAFVALLLSTAELIYMARKERMSLLPIFLRPSTTTLAPGKPVGTIVEYFGLVGAVWQCFYSTVEYAYARQKRENPIKMSLLPFIFLLCVVISKLIKK